MSNDTKTLFFEKCIIPVLIYHLIQHWQTVLYFRSTSRYGAVYAQATICLSGIIILMWQGIFTIYSFSRKVKSLVAPHLFIVDLLVFTNLEETLLSSNEPQQVASSSLSGRGLKRCATALLSFSFLSCRLMMT